MTSSIHCNSSIQSEYRYKYLCTWVANWPKGNSIWISGQYLVLCVMPLYILYQCGPIRNSKSWFLYQIKLVSDRCWRFLKIVSTLIGHPPENQTFLSTRWLTASYHQIRIIWWWFDWPYLIWVTIDSSSLDLIWVLVILEDGKFIAVVKWASTHKESVPIFGCFLWGQWSGLIINSKNTWLRSEHSLRPDYPAR